MNVSISSKDFNFVYNNGVVIKTPKILYRVLPSKGLGQIGFIVSGKLGRASKRNLFRRRIKFLYNRHFAGTEKKVDMIIAPQTINLSWEEIKDSFKLMSERIYDI